MNTVLIGVCTAQRPQMLRRCLDSLAAQQVPDDVSPVLAVVDNEVEPNNQAAIEDFASACPFPVRYAHEPRRGTPIARNRILDEALAIGANWIAFIDDDETAAPDWLAMLMAPEKRDVPILKGQRSFVPPEPEPFWYIHQQETFRDGDAIHSADGNNVRFTAQVVAEGYRFDETMAFTGGSDIDFFTRLRRDGYETRYTAAARTFEHVHIERMTYRGIIARRFHHATAKLHRGAKLGKPVTWRKSLSAPPTVVAGLATLAVSPLVLPVSRPLFKRLALEGGEKIARASARVAALSGIVPQPYRQIDGH